MIEELKKCKYAKAKLDPYTTNHHRGLIPANEVDQEVKQFANQLTAPPTLNDYKQLVRLLRARDFSNNDIIRKIMTTSFWNINKSAYYTGDDLLCVYLDVSITVFRINSFSACLHRLIILPTFLFTVS